MKADTVKEYTKETGDYALFHGTARILDREVRVTEYATACGLNVLLEGGDQGHIGSVSVAVPGMSVQSIVLPGHKEDIVSERWAARLCREKNVPVVVSAGIHFDEMSKEQSAEALEGMDRLLRALIARQEEKESTVCRKIQP